MGNHSDITISLGGKLTDILIKEAKISESKIRVIPNGIDLRYAKSLKKDIDEIEKSFLFVGRLAYNKGVGALIEVFNALEKPNLYIIGSGPQEKLLKRSAKGENIKFLGKVSEEVLYEWYSKVQCLIFPSLGEGMPTVILEAMAMKLPIIASDVGSISTMVNEKNGFLINPNDKESLKKAIESFLNKGKTKLSMGEESYKLVKNKFQWKKVAEQTYESLEKIIKSKSDRKYF